MTMDKSVPFLFALSILSLSACSGGGGSGSTSQDGTLSIGLIDAPATDVTQIWVEIAQVNIKPQGSGPALEFPLEPNLQVDLLTLDVDNAEMLLDSETVPAGAYNWLELVVNADFDGEFDSYVVTSMGGMEELVLEDVELQVPSGSLRLVSGFTVTANQETSFYIDWDMRRGLVAPPGRPGYMLRPAFRIVDMTEFGTLSGTIALAAITGDPSCADDDADLDVGNVVYIFEGLDVMPDDIDAADAEPVATAVATPNDVGDYVYETILSPGDYTVAFTCQAGNDDPDIDDDIAFAAPSSFTLGADDTVDYSIGVEEM